MKQGSMQARSIHTSGSSVFEGLRLVRRDESVEITYPSRIHSAARACSLAQAHGLEARDMLDGRWTVRDHVSAGASAERLADFFADLNRSPSRYPHFTSDDQAPRPLVSCIVVVTENLPFVESQLLPSLAIHSKGHAIEVILVFNGSFDVSAVTAPVKCLQSDWGSVAAAYNRGAAVAVGEYVAFFHDDCIIDDRLWIDKCLAATREGGGAAAGECRHIDAIGRINIPKLPIAKAVPLFMRKQDFLALGGYDEFHYVGYEDLDFTLALLQRGGKLAFPAIDVRHFNGMSSTLKYYPVEGLSQLYALAAIPRGSIRQRFREFAARGVVKDGLDYLRLALDVQLLYILKKYQGYLSSIDRQAYSTASHALERQIVTRSPVDATKVVSLFRELDQILYGDAGVCD